MKAVLLAAGEGIRLGQFTAFCNKCALPIGGRPLIEYSLDHIETALFQHIIDSLIVVVGYQKHSVIDCLSNWYPESVAAQEFLHKLSIVWQEKQGSMLDAIKCAESYVDDDDFVLLLGDEIIVHSDPIAKMYRKFMDEHCMGVIGYSVENRRERIQRTFSIDTSFDEEYFLVEKPQFPPHTKLMGTGMGIFTSQFFKYCDEKTYPDAIMKYAQFYHQNIELCQIGNEYYNINTQDDYHEAEVRFKLIKSIN